MLKIGLAMAFIAILANYPTLAMAGATADGKPPLNGAMENFSLAETTMPAPDIKFKDAGGKQHNMSAWKGKVVLLNFWATWCAPCRREMPALDALQAAFADRNFEVIALSSDRKGLDAVKPFYEKIGIKNLKTYIDPTLKAQRAFRVIGLPTTVLIDAGGNIVGRMAGPAEWDNEDAQALIGHFLN
jgi:thiol-disulfide isomerase/thioredoxin